MDELVAADAGGAGLLIAVTAVAPQVGVAVLAAAQVNGPYPRRQQVLGRPAYLRRYLANLMKR